MRHVQYNNDHKVNASRGRHSNNRKLNAVEAGRLSHKRNPPRVRCPELNERRGPRTPSGLRHRHSVLRSQCNSSSGRNHSLKPNALRDLRSSNDRRATALVVQPNDHSKTPGRNSRRSTRAVRRLNAAVAAVARASPTNLANLINRKEREPHGW